MSLVHLQRYFAVGSEELRPVLVAELPPVDFRHGLVEGLLVGTAKAANAAF